MNEFDLRKKHLCGAIHAKSPYRSQNSSDLRIVDNLHGKCVITNSPIPAGTLLYNIEGKVFKSPNRWSIQIDEDLHLTPDRHPWAMVNHHCNPNAVIDLNNRSMTALRDLHSGEEITWNYLTTEWSLATSFTCTCGHQECFGEIKGFGYLSDFQKHRLSHSISPILAQMWRNRREQAVEK